MLASALEMKMQTIAAIAYIVLLIWVEPASAQSTYSLSVSRHPSIMLREQDVERILADASKLLQKKSGHVDRPDDVACNVTFKRNGPVRTFASPNTPAIIETESDLFAVHGENSNVKVVKKINFCKGIHMPFRGCSWPHHFGTSLIVVFDAPHPDLLWAHEFGHLTVLWHRNDQLALMSPCPLTAKNVKVDRAECSCFLSGPGSCQTPEVTPRCSK